MKTKSFKTKGGEWCLASMIERFICDNPNIQIISLACYSAGEPFFEDRAILIYNPKEES